jgi:glycosyltransferase involved in cell wall biosynthesis
MQKKIVVLHFARIISRNDFVDSIVSNLDKEKFQVVVCTLRGEYITEAPQYEQNGVPHIILNIKSELSYFRIVRRLIKVIDEYKVDVLHTHLWHEALIGAFIKFLRPKLKFVIGRHYSDEMYLNNKGLRLKGMIWAETFKLYKSEKIIAASTFVKNILLKQGAPERKIAYLTYGFNFSHPRYQPLSSEEKSAIRQELGIKENEVFFINVGRLYHLKGQDVLLNVFKKFVQQNPLIKLIIVGGGPEEESLKKLSEELDLDQSVIFTGPRPDAYRLISASDVVVHPTYTELFSQLMIEAMALGKLLIISRVSAVEDQIKNYETGIIITPGSFDELYAAMKFAADNPQKREEIGRKARAYVLENLNIKKVIKGYENLYTELVSVSSEQ